MFNIQKGFTGLAEMLGAAEHSGTIGKILNSSVNGSIVGGIGTYGYNKATGRNASVGKGMMLGALGFGGLRVGRSLPKIDWKGIGRTGRELFRGSVNTDGMKSLLGGMENKYGNGARGLLNRTNFGRTISPYTKGVIPGAMIGAGGGAVYGAFSDRDSMVSGAFKGAVIGGAVSAAAYHFGGGFSKMSANKAANPIGKASRTFSSPGIRSSMI